MTLTQNPAEQMAIDVIMRAESFFRRNKNFGALTAIKRKDSLKAKMEWIGSYCDKKSIDKEQFMYE